jgi:O-antigen ligase
LETHRPAGKEKEVLRGAFFWLSAFYLVYCARPADSIPLLGYIPLAKITGLLAFVALVMTAGKTPRRFKDLPREASYLTVMLALLFASSFLSPIWRGGAFFTTLDLAKMYVAWILTFLLITSLTRLRRIIFIQCSSVAVVSLVAIVKGHSIPRLNGVIGGFYSNPNDMAFAIVLSLPFCLAFLLTAKGAFRKAIWSFAMLCMAIALVLTASRAGFIDLLVAGTVCLWHFGIRGKRLYLIAGTAFVGIILLLTAGRNLMKRFAAISSDTIDSQMEATARESYEERKFLMFKAIEAVEHYPILGVGPGDFIVYSGKWKDVHASYLEIAADGGIPVLILYLLFFARGFANLRFLRKMKHLPSEAKLFAGALTSSLVGFAIGACFAPEAYQFFPYFTVCYTSVLFALVTENQGVVLGASKPLLIRRHGFAAT